MGKPPKTTNRPTRRSILKATGVALGIGSLPLSAERTVAQSSPDLAKYVQPLPIPEVREPDGTCNSVDYYEIPVVEFTQNLHPDLPATTLWGFDGQYPGPIIQANRHEPIKIRFDNPISPPSIC